jgi:hypothetical protein
MLGAPRMKLARLATLALLVPMLLPLGCAPEESTSAQTGDEEDLTSLSARSRELRFDGYVFVQPTASDYTILKAVRAQTQTAFGALRTSNVGVNSRELKDVDTKSFKKTNVTVIDTSKPGDVGVPMVRVAYRYKDKAVVPVDMARRSAITIAVMGPSYPQQTSRVLKECTANDEEANEFSDALWYVFDPSLSSCQSAISAEQKQIDAAKELLDDPKTQVSKLEVERLYLPTTAALGADKTNQGKDYPEYHRLFKGGVQPGKLVIGMVNGFIDHGTTDYTDSGYGEWMEQLRESFRGHSNWNLAKIEPAEDLSTFTVNGKTVSNVSFQQILRWEIDGTGFPSNLSYSDRKALRKAVGDKLIRHWVTFDAPVTVKIGTDKPRPLTLEIQTYFGAEGDSTPHKRGIKTSDVFLYNGHSYIGYGPLDPSNFSASDFPKTYQILFIDGCVSYNYYEKDYFPLKYGGTKNLDLITNGIEAPSWKSGYALGQFVSALVSGSQPSYLDLLDEASDTDALRVVDGEVDNYYTPAKKPITMQ